MLQYYRKRLYELSGGKDNNIGIEGKVLRVFSSGRWLPRNQG